MPYVLIVMSVYCSLILLWDSPLQYVEVIQNNTNLTVKFRNHKLRGSRNECAYPAKLCKELPLENLEDTKYRVRLFS